MRGRGPSFGEVLGVREFRSLWAAELFSVLGDQLARVALAVLVYQRTSSAALTALTYALTFAPAVLGGALLSGLADRYPRRLVLVVTDLTRAVLAAAMAVPGLPLPALWVIVGMLSMAGAPFKAAQLALLPLILDGERYVVGLSLRQVTGQSAQLVGFACGGLLLAVIEPHVALAANAATFLLSALLIVTGVAHRDAAAPRKDKAEQNGTGGPLSANRQLLPIVALFCLAGLFVVPEGVAAPYGAAIGVGSVGVGLLMAADPLGSVLGALLTGLFPIRPSPLSAVALAAGSGLPLIFCAPGPGLVLSIMLWAVSGALSTAYLIQTQALVVTLVPDHRRGRVMGRIATCLYTSQGLAIVAGGLAAEAVGPFRAVAGAGLLGTVIALCVGVWWRRVARSRRDLVAGSEHGRGQRMIANQISLLRTRSTSSRTSGRDGGVVAGQISLFDTKGTSSRASGDGLGSAGQISLFDMKGTSSWARRWVFLRATAQISLLATGRTSSWASSDHGLRAGQISLFATGHTSSMQHVDDLRAMAQISLLAMKGTSSTASFGDDAATESQISLFDMNGTSSGASGRAGTRTSGQISLFDIGTSSQAISSVDEPATGLFLAQGFRSRNRRLGAQTPSLWGCPLRTAVHRLVVGRVTTA